MVLKVQVHEETDKGREGPQDPYYGGRNKRGNRRGGTVIIKEGHQGIS